MKRILFTILAVLIVSLTAFAQYPSDRTRIIKKELRMQDTSVVNLQGRAYIQFSDSATIVGGSEFTKLDSFAVTSARDTISWRTAEVGDLILVFPYTPAYSATADTGSTQYRGFVTASGTVYIDRTKLTAASTLKSGAQYWAILIKQ